MIFAARGEPVPQKTAQKSPQSLLRAPRKHSNSILIIAKFTGTTAAKMSAQKKLRMNARIALPGQEKIENIKLCALDHFYGGWCIEKGASM